MTIMGIDPGLRGAICKVKFREAQIIGATWETYPTWQRQIGQSNRSEYSISEMLQVFKGMLDKDPPDRIYLEHVWGLPKDTPMTAFKFGKGLGILETCLHSNNRSDYHLVPPLTWEGIMHLGISKKLTPKHRSEYKVSEIFPQMLEETKHDGIIDAFLIAVYGYFKESGVIIR